MKKFLLVTGALSTFAISTTVLAAYVGGGEWHYGAGWSGTYGYSNYIHNSKQHSATVVNHDEDGNEIGKNRDEESPGNWAKASITKIPPVGLTYHWNAW